MRQYIYFEEIHGKRHPVLISQSASFRKFEGVGACNGQEEWSFLIWEVGGRNKVIGACHRLHPNNHKSRSVEARRLFLEVVLRRCVRSRYCDEIKAHLILFRTLQLNLEMTCAVQGQLVAGIIWPSLPIVGTPTSLRTFPLAGHLRKMLVIYL